MRILVIAYLVYYRLSKGLRSEDLLCILIRFEVIVYTTLYTLLRSHIIIIIIILELFILKTFLIIIYFGLRRGISIYFVYLFTTLRVAEAAVGISLLTLMVRSHGDDYMSIL